MHLNPLFNTYILKPRSNSWRKNFLFVYDQMSYITRLPLPLIVQEKWSIGYNVIHNLNDLSIGIQHSVLASPCSQDFIRRSEGFIHSWKLWDWSIGFKWLTRFRSYLEVFRLIYWSYLMSISNIKFIYLIQIVGFIHLVVQKKNIEVITETSGGKESYWNKNTVSLFLALWIQKRISFQSLLLPL